MSYTPTVWQTGDTITAEKLNKLENGVGDVFVVSCDVDFSSSTYNVTPTNVSATVSDIFKAFSDGKIVLAKVRISYGYSATEEIVMSRAQIQDNPDNPNQRSVTFDLFSIKEYSGGAEALILETYGLYCGFSPQDGSDSFGASVSTYTINNV